MVSWKMAIAFCFALMAFLGAPALGEDAELDFQKLLQEATKNAQSPEGEAFERAVAEQFQKYHASTVKRCFEKLENPDLSKFHLLIQLSRQGNPRKILVDPETNMALCVQRGIKADEYPRPPTPDYWVHTLMNFGVD